MTEIPEDILNTAGEIASDLLFKTTSERQHVIARAILAERAKARNDALEEAAEVARVMWLKSQRGVIGDADREDELCEEIASAIRAMKTGEQ